MSELTSSSRSTVIDSPCSMTAESVKMFMKSVNRIRFNSLTATNSMETSSSSKKIGGKHRSRSCPQFPKIESMSEEEEEVSRSASTTCNDSSMEAQTSDIQVSAADLNTSASSQVCEAPCDISIASTNSTVTVNTKQETTVTITSTSSTEVTVGKCPIYTRTVSGTEHRCDEDFVQILRQALNASSGVVCCKCQGPVNEAQSGNKFY